MNGKVVTGTITISPGTTDAKAATFEMLLGENAQLTGAKQQGIDGTLPNALAKLMKDNYYFDPKWIELTGVVQRSTLISNLSNSFCFHR